MQPEFLIGLMDALGIERAVLVGNSQGGTIAVQTVLAYPNRVEALILADPAIYTTGGFPPEYSWLYASPQMRRLGPVSSRQFLGEANAEELLKLAWHDPSKLTAAERADSAKYGQIHNRYRALWEYTIAGETLDIAERVGTINVPTLVIAGDDDRIIPTPEHARLASEIPAADYFLIAQCGHVPQEEQPEEFLRAVAEFMRSLK
jgi:pimeloyl-ACP methyl ester carboxylesterase